MTDLMLVARNTAPDSPNVIHTEEARRFGFQGGIVPGLTLFGYLSRPLVDQYGPEWLAEGQLDVRFRQPVYDGDQLTLQVEPIDGDEGHMSLRILNADGVECVRGSALRYRDDREIDVSAYKSIPFDGAPLQDGTPALLGQLPDLKEWELDTDEASVAEFLEKLGDDDPLYRQILHPVVIARVSAYIVGRRFNFGPRIHVGVRSRFLATASIGAKLVGRGRIAKVWEHKGNHYLVSDLLVVDENERPIMQIDSESLFQLGGGQHG
ncbi:MAG: hypothetical protein CL424_15860 [Acidimicrobiaceae bacterium]|nr:hypothetical protein [Acidimicrobiaceae bacterium]